MMTGCASQLPVAFCIGLISYCFLSPEIETMRIVIVAIVSWIVVTLVIASASAATWAWTPPAAHHRSIGIITQLPYSGTAFLVSPSHIATAAHVVENNNRAVFLPPGGGPYAATVIYRGSNGNDVALLRLDRPITDRPIIPIATARAPAGARLEIAGYGGPTRKLRHWHSIMQRDGRCHSSVISGDSGGPVLHNGRCVGIISGGTNTRAFRAEGNTNWKHVFPVAIGYPTPLRSFLFGVERSSSGYG
jgi:secreted trypsin-like serine protease